MADKDVICPACGEAFQNQNFINDLLKEEKVRGLQFVKAHFSDIYKDYMEKKKAKEAAQEKAYCTTITRSPVKCDKCRANLNVISMPDGFGVIRSAIALPIVARGTKMEDCLAEDCMIKKHGKSYMCAWCTIPKLEKNVENEHEEKEEDPFHNEESNGDVV